MYEWTKAGLWGGFCLIISCHVSSVSRSPDENSKKSNTAPLVLSLIHIYIKRVYTIVMIQKSTAEFHRCPQEYLHYARQTFNTGLELDMLQEYLLIPLDIFRENHQNISRKLDAWLLFIASDQPCDIREVIELSLIHI